MMQQNFRPALSTNNVVASVDFRSGCVVVGTFEEWLMNGTIYLLRLWLRYATLGRYVSVPYPPSLQSACDFAKDSTVRSTLVCNSCVLL